MQKGKVDLREELQKHKFEFNLLQRIPCSKQEIEEYRKILKNGGKLPDGVYVGELDDDFYTIYESDLTEAEIREYLTYKQLSLIRTIKNCAVFFVLLTIIGMISYLILLNL